MTIAASSSHAAFFSMATRSCSSPWCKKIWLISWLRASCAVRSVASYSERSMTTAMMWSRSSSRTKSSGASDTPKLLGSYSSGGGNAGGGAEELPSPPLRR